MIGGKVILLFPNIASSSTMKQIQVGWRARSLGWTQSLKTWEQSPQDLPCSGQAVERSHPSLPPPLFFIYFFYFFLPSPLSTSPFYSTQSPPSTLTFSPLDTQSSNYWTVNKLISYQQTWILNFLYGVTNNETGAGNLLNLKWIVCMFHTWSFVVLRRYALFVFLQYMVLFKANIVCNPSFSSTPTAKS